MEAVLKKYKKLEENVRINLRQLLKMIETKTKMESLKVLVQFIWKDILITFFLNKTIFHIF